MRGLFQLSGMHCVPRLGSACSVSSPVQPSASTGATGDVVARPMAPSRPSSSLRRQCPRSGRPSTARVSAVRWSTAVRSVASSTVAVSLRGRRATSRVVSSMDLRAPWPAITVLSVRLNSILYSSCICCIRFRLKNEHFYLSRVSIMTGISIQQFCLSVCLSVSSSRSAIVSKRLNISSQFLHHTVTQSF